MKDGYYIYKDNPSNSYNIKEIYDIKSEYVMDGIDNWATLFKCTIKYKDNNNQNKSFEIAVIIPEDNKEAYEMGLFDRYTGTTSFVRGFSEMRADDTVEEPKRGTKDDVLKGDFSYFAEMYIFSNGNSSEVVILDENGKVTIDGNVFNEKIISVEKRSDGSYYCITKTEDVEEYEGFTLYPEGVKCTALLKDEINKKRIVISEGLGALGYVEYHGEYIGNNKIG